MTTSDLPPALSHVVPATHPSGLIFAPRQPNLTPYSVLKPPTVGRLCARAEVLSCPLGPSCLLPHRRPAWPPCRFKHHLPEPQYEQPIYVLREASCAVPTGGLPGAPAASGHTRGRPEDRARTFCLCVSSAGAGPGIGTTLGTPVLTGWGR